MKRLFSTLAEFVLMVVALVILLLPASCGKGMSGLDTMEPEVLNRGSPATETGSLAPQSLDEALAELDALAMPPQANPETWLALKTKLRELLTAKYGEGKGTNKWLPEGRPLREHASKDYVKPRNLHWEKDIDSYSPSPYGKLVWTYVNDGDYTQNGVVAISDITPLAVHVILEGQGRPVDEENTILELIDEDGKEDDGDGYVDFNEELEYDGVNDATADDLDTIAWNFGVDVAKYQVWGTNTPEAPESWTMVDEVLFEDKIAISGMRHEFEYVLANGDYRYYKVRPLSLTPGSFGEYYWQTGPDENDPILESDIWQMAAPTITEVKQVPEPATVGMDYKVYFFAVKSSDSPGTFAYEWAFPEALVTFRDGTGPTSESPMVSVLRVPDENDICSVTVTNPYGQDTFYFEIVVGEYPPEIVSVEPLQVEPGSEVTFYGSIIGSRTVNYDWEFGDAGTVTEEGQTIAPADNEQRAWATVTVTNSPGRYTITLEAENAYGSAGPDEFELVVGDPPAINSISPTSAMSGDLVEFTADISGSEPFTYDWAFPNGWTPTSSNDPSPEVTVGRGGSVISPGALYYVILTVNNAVGPADTETFEFYVDAQWHVQVVDEAISAEEGMKATSLEFFADDRPGIAYERTGELWFAEQVGGNWVLTPVDQNAQADVGAYASHEVDGTGDVHVAYFDETNGYLMYATRQSGVWQTPDIAIDPRYWPPLGTFGEYCDLALSPGEQIGISFFHRGRSNLFAAFSSDGDNWVWEQVELGTQPVGYPGEYTSLKFRNDGVAVVSYNSWITDSSRILRTAFDSNPMPPWAMEMVDIQPLSGFFSSLELHPLTQEPHIAYQRSMAGTHTLWLAKRGLGWKLTQVDDTRGTGYYASLELDPGFREGISHHYEGLEGSQLWLTYRDPLNFVDPWQSVTVPQPHEYDTWAVGLHTSLAYCQLNGMEYGFDSYPAISYVNRSPGVTTKIYRLMYAYWW